MNLKNSLCVIGANHNEAPANRQKPPMPRAPAGTLGERWNSRIMYTGGGCLHDRDPQLADATWSGTDRIGIRPGAAGKQIAQNWEAHAAAAAAWQGADRESDRCGHQTVRGLAGALMEQSVLDW